MTAVTREEPEVTVEPRQTYNENRPPFAQAKKLRVIQLASYPTKNRGARANLQTIHERLQARGHESVVIQMTPSNQVKQPGVHYPRSTLELARLLLRTPADVVHLHIGSVLTLPKLALASIVNKLPRTKKIFTLHLDGRSYPKRGSRPWFGGATGIVLRQFETLIATNSEIASFVAGMGVPAKRMHLITPFPRLALAESTNLSPEIENFCRQHTPLLASVGDFEPGSDLPKQFDILNKVRERYPSAGLIAIGTGALHLKLIQERALHKDCNHIELTGDLPETAAGELIRRANVLLHSGENHSDPFAVQEAFKAKTPVVNTNQRPRGEPATMTAEGEVETAFFQVLRSLQIARPQHEDAPAALSDGVDDVIRLYKLAAKPEKPAPLNAAYEWPSIG